MQKRDAVIFYALGGLVAALGLPAFGCSGDGASELSQGPAARVVPDVTDDEPRSGSGSSDAGSGGVSAEGGKGKEADAATALDPNDPFAMERKRCFEVNNEIRKVANVPPLARASAAEEACVDDQAQQEYSLPAESPGFPGRPHGKLYMCKEARQNHSDGTTSPLPGCTGACASVKFVEEAVRRWYYDDAASGNAHKYQMTDPAMKRLACGFYRDASGYLWINADYY